MLEDSTVDAEIVQRLLRKERPDFELSLAMNKEEYLLALDSYQPDLILCDNSLPQFDAAEALDTTRSVMPHIPFIMVTGTVSEEFAVGIIKAGADDYIIKDRLARLPAAIDAAIKQREAEKEKLEALERLTLNEEKYRTLVERVSDGFIALDTNWHIVYINQQAGQLFNRPPVWLLGKNIWKEFPEGVGKSFYKAYHQAMETQENIHLEEYSFVADRWVQANIYPSPSGISVYFRDITEQRNAEMKVKESEERYRTLIERITDAFIALDKNFCYTYMNKQAGELIHRDPGAVLGKNVWEEFPDAVGSITYETFNTAMKEQRYMHSIDYYAPLGLWQENFIYPSPDGLSVFIRDISEMKRAERQKEFDRNNLDALINNTNDLMWSMDKDFKLITFNDAFNKLIRLVSGKPLAQGDNILSAQFTEDQLERYKTFYERALSGETFTIIDHFSYPTEFWSEISFYPIRKDDHVIGTACFSRDITERKKTEKALQEMELEILNQRVQEQKKIARAIINAQEKERKHIGQELHDNISQILVSTKMFLGAAGSGNEVLKELIKYPLELIDSSIQEIRSLSSKNVTPLKNVDLRELVQLLLDKLRENTAIKTVFVCNVANKDIHDDLKLNIYRIIQEQTNNIVKYAAPRNVSISIQKERKMLRIIVEDDGKGFDVNKKRKGIGISNMMNRIESFNGDMIIESAPGSGCRIAITIPY